METNTRFLKVSAVPQGSKHVPGIKISGIYLKSFGFNLDDQVAVICKPDCLIIKKAAALSKDLKSLVQKNPNLLTLIDSLSLEEL